MKSYGTKSHRNLQSTEIHGIVTPEGADNAPVILVISSSSIIMSTINAYLIDHGYRIAGPFESHDGASAFIRRYTPDLVIFDATNNSPEFQLFQETINKEIKSTPIIILGNNTFNFKADIMAHLNLPVNHQDLGNKIRELIPFIDVSPIEQLIKFVNKFFLKLIQLGPEQYRRTIEERIKETIYEFCSRNSDFTKQSGESTSILITTHNKVNVSNVIQQLKFYIDDMIVKINECCFSNWAGALVKDSVETLLLRMSPLPKPVLEFAETIGVDTREFQRSIARMIPKLDDNEKAIFVAFFSHDDLGPQLLMHVTNDKEISKGIDNDLAAQVMTIVGQGTSYHEGIYGPIPIPTANNICAVIWSKILDSEIKDERMDGKSLCVVAIGFNTTLMTHLPQSEILRTIFEGLANISHVNDLSDIHLELIKDNFLKSLI